MKLPAANSELSFLTCGLTRRLLHFHPKGWRIDPNYLYLIIFNKSLTTLIVLQINSFLIFGWCNSALRLSNHFLYETSIHDLLFLRIHAR
jgi:hypothetical protein